MRYSDEFIETIKDANDIVDVVGTYVQLKKKGRSYFGLCPFHNEKTPSFSVSGDKQIFHCFGCGKGGSVFQFVQEIENITFPEAIEFLANRANITIPKNTSSFDNKRDKLKKRCYMVNYEATKYFQQTLLDKTSKEAHDYINQRKMNKETIIDFKIGYSKIGLYKYLKQKGFYDNEILETGLVYKTDNGKYIDRYRDRLMFPILDVQGRVIGFGGRILTSDKKFAKYINSNDNMVYNKSRSLYNINNAKKYAKDSVIVVEGYMDCISLYQNGIKNVVASLGTALTDGQARLMLRYTNKVIIGYDSDAAGTNATIRGLDILKNMGADLRVLRLKGAKDPDEYILKYGADSLRKRIDESISYIEFKTKMYAEKYNLERTDEKAKFINDLITELAKLDNAVEQELYLNKFSDEYNIPKNALDIELKKKIRKEKANEITEEDFEKNIQKLEENKTIDRQKYIYEKLIIYAYIENKEYRNIIKENILEYMFEDEINKKTLHYIYNIENDNMKNILENIEDKDILSRITEIQLAEDIVIDDKKIIMALRYFKNSELEKEKAVILKALTNNELDEESKKMLEHRLNEIIQEMIKK